ncbi:hypothetical protein QTP88_017652 [Uroleucon formosanum]
MDRPANNQIHGSARLYRTHWSCNIVTLYTSDSENEMLETRNDLEPITEYLNSQSTTSLNDFDQPSTNKLLSPERTEEIHKALSKMIAMNQMPLSFCSSPGFKYFMNVVDPNYKPCSAESVKNRLKLLTSDIRQLIKKELNEVTNVSCTTDCWTSISQDSYITIICHTIDQHWKPKSYTLTTHEVNERHHTAVNLAHHLKKSLIEWEIEKKISSIVTDNAANVINAVSQLELNDNMEKSGLTCAAHSLQLAVNKTLLDDEIQSVLTKSSKIVCHFKHSSISMKSLEKTQQQLNLPKLTLLQYYRNITASNIAQKLEITESEWLIIEKLLVLLKSLQALTTLFCGELESYVSMVRPLMHKIVTSHYEHGIDDDNMTERFKNTISYQLTTRFELTWKDIITARHVASFLDPRYKDMDHESVKAREIIRSHVLQLIESVAPTIKNPSDTEESDLKMSNVLSFIYKDHTNSTNDASTQFTEYLSEPQLRFDLNPLEWWRTREEKYPAIATIAKKYFAIPSTSASSEKCFSTAGNIVNPKKVAFFLKM